MTVIKKSVRILLFLLLAAFSTAPTYGQVSIEKCTKKKVKIIYKNESDTSVLYFKPFIFLPYDPKTRKIGIRYDRIKLKNDTLIIYLNDTSIADYPNRENPFDEAEKNSGSWENGILPPNTQFVLTIYFLRKYSYRIIEVHYMFDNKQSIAYKER